MSSRGNRSATPKVQPNVSASSKAVAPNKPEEKAAEAVNTEDAEPAPQANIPQATEVPTSNNGMMTLLNRHGQPTELPEKTALFLLKKYPSRYSPIN